MCPRAIGLSKSRVMAGLQCHKRLWWTVHETTALELLPDEAFQAVFDEGTRVGEVARTSVPGDPRPALAERLIRACEPGRSVVAYNAGFERRCLVKMADALPALADPLRSIADRLVDLLPAVRNQVYHPDFGGSFSLKDVLPAMVAGASLRHPGHRRRRDDI